MFTTFVIISIVIFMFLCFAWKSSDIVNLSLKIFFGSMIIFGCYILFNGRLG